MLRRRYIYSVILFIGLVTNAQGQDSLAVEAKKNYVYITIDYGKLLETAIGDQVKWEFGAGVLLSDHFSFIVEYGFGKLKPKNVINNGSYTSEGNYIRGGFDYAFEVVPNRFLSFGLLFAYSRFKDEGQVQIDSEIWDNLNESFQRDDLSAQWLELVISTEGPILKNSESYLSNIYWGSKLRIRMMLSESATQNFDIFAVPGYGRRYRNVVPAINLFLKFKFPIK